MTGGNMLVGHNYDEDYDLDGDYDHYHEYYDDNDDDDGLPANYHQSHSHQVGICHNDEGWEYDTVRFPPHT